MKRIVLLFALILALFLLFPTLLSSFLGKPIVCHLLGKRLQGNVNIKTLHLSWLGPQIFEGISIQTPQWEGALQKVQISAPFWRLLKTNNALLIQEGNLSLRNQPDYALKHLNAKIQTPEIFASASTPSGGSLHIQGKIFSNAHFDVVFEANRLPTPLIDRIGGFHQVLPFLLGPEVTIEGSIVWEKEEGPLSLKVISPYFRTMMEGRLKRHGFFLERPLKAVWDRFPPFDLPMGGFIEAQDPIFLTIQSAFIPLSPFRLHDVQIDQASLNLGQMQLQGVKPLLSLLKLFQKGQTKGSVPCWFTPVALQMRKGELEWGRMDALIDHAIHVCTWGSCDLLNDQIEGFLGIPADTLSAYFSIPNLSPQYVLKIPIQGSFKNPEFITGPALAKITALSASQHLPSKTGKAIGGILHAIIQSKDDEVPPPNRPFPWEK